jgi:Transposase DDE domain
VRALVPPADGHAKTPEAVHPEVRQMRATLATDEGKETYKGRAAIVEAVDGQIRHNRGVTQILRRGLNAPPAGVDLIAATHNLLKLVRRPAPAT